MPSTSTGSIRTGIRGRFSDFDGHPVSYGADLGTILHVLRSEPDDITAALIAEVSNGSVVAVTCLYPDKISAAPVDWNRLVDDIFTYDRVLCW